MDLIHLPYFIEAFPKRTVKSQTLQGHSVSTERTGFYSYTIGAHFDAGLACYIPVKRLFLTHTHLDHHRHLTSLIHSNPKPPIIYCPSSVREKLQVGIDAYYQSTYDYHPYVLKGVNPGYEEEFESQGRQYIMKVHNCYHSVPCVCYSFSEKRQKLKEEYQGLVGKELGRLRKEGLNITEEIKVPVFAYVCDTSIEGLTEELLEYQVVMIECTFWEKELEDRAEKTGHICWTNLEKIIKDHPQTHFILFHVSKRYSWDQLRKIVEESRLSNITLWSDD